MIRPERNDARMIRWIGNHKKGDKSSTEELLSRLQLNTVRKYLQNKNYYK